MKFNEKLIKLRKEKGLSQEELGYELNVTRQTVSKWELGQTTPEMDKLLEMSKLFGITLDELTGDSDISESYTGEEKTKRKNITIIVILVIIILFAIAFLITKALGASFGFIKGVFGQVQSTSDYVKGQASSIQEQINSVTDESSDTTTTIFNFLKKTQDDYDKQKEESKVYSFNFNFETNSGTVWGTGVQSLLDDIIKSNQTNDRKVTVKYNDVETTDAAEIRSLKRKFDNTTKKYEVYFEYDENGYIYEAFIEEI